MLIICCLNFGVQISMAVRRAFTHAFVNDVLDVKHNELKEQLDWVLSVSKYQTPPLCISHTFRMKIIEVYRHIGKKIFVHPNSLHNYIDCKQHLVQFGATLNIN